MPLILLRHTRPLGCDGICYGRTDVPVGDDLAEEAERILPALPRFERVVTSPLSRCRLLARLLAERAGVSLDVDARLAEMDFGQWEGRPWDEIAREEIEAWASDLHHARPHCGESVADLCARVAEALADWGASGGAVLIVTHAGVARAALALAGAESPWSFSLGYGTWIEA